MNTFLIHLWKRRWCRFAAVGVLLCGLLISHPFMRQSAFGPTIDGVPWYACEDEFRRQVHGDQKALIPKILEAIGLLAPHRVDVGSNVSATVLLLHLADD